MATGDFFYSKHKQKSRSWEEVIKKLKKGKLQKEVLVKADQRRKRKSKNLIKSL